MILANPSAESLIRFLAFLGGVASTLVGSWVSSKIHGYHENRKVHLEDIKQKVLSPLSYVLSNEFGALVTHKSPVVLEQWGTRSRNDTAGVTEPRTDEGPLLAMVVPDIRAGLDPALYADARKNHFSRLIKQVELFSDSWRKHSSECYAWVSHLSDEILAKSQLAPFPVRQYGTPYVNHHKLAVFAYRRLFNPAQHALIKHSREHPPTVWLLEGFEGTSAEGSEQQLTALVSVLDELVVAEKTAADRLQANARALEKTLSSLCSELNYAIASRRLRRRCDLVPFF
jgi:hypothetical protein